MTSDDGRSVSDCHSISLIVASRVERHSRENHKNNNSFSRVLGHCGGPTLYGP